MKDSKQRPKLEINMKKREKELSKQKGEREK